MRSCHGGQSEVDRGHGPLLQGMRPSPILWVAIHGDSSIPRGTSRHKWRPTGLASHRIGIPQDWRPTGLATHRTQPVYSVVWHPSPDSDGHHTGTRRAHPQPEEHRPRHTARPAHRDHRAVGLGQVLAGFRHAVCRGPAPLRRVAVDLRAAVPVGDGEARRRPHRGAVAGDLDRAEIDLAQPALHRGHHHRDPRLPAPAVRARRRAALPAARAAARGADREPDGRRGAGDARGREADAAGTRGARAQGRARAVAGAAARQRLRARARRRARGRARRRARARQAAQAHHRGGGGPLSRAHRPGAAPRGILRDRAGAGRGAGDHRPDGRAGRGAGVLGALCVPALRPQHPGAGAAAVLVQQPRRRLPELRRPRGAAVLRRGAHRAEPRREPGAGRDPRLGPAQRLLLPPARLAGGALRLQPGHALRGTGARAARARAATAAARRTSASTT